MIYIAGKISGLPYNEAEQKFKETELQFRRNGVATINPMEMGMKNWSYEDQLAECFKVIELHATAIYLLNDWATSNGAMQKFAFVGNLNLKRKHGDRIEIYYEKEDGFNATVEGIKARNLKKSLIPTEYEM